MALFQWLLKLPSVLQLPYIKVCCWWWLSHMVRSMRRQWQPELHDHSRHCSAAVTFSHSVACHSDSQLSRVWHWRTNWQLSQSTWDWKSVLPHGTIRLCMKRLGWTAEKCCWMAVRSYQWRWTSVHQLWAALTLPYVYVSLAQPSNFLSHWAAMAIAVKSRTSALHNTVGWKSDHRWR